MDKQYWVTCKVKPDMERNKGYTVTLDEVVFMFIIGDTAEAQIDDESEVRRDSSGHPGSDDG